MVKKIRTINVDIDKWNKFIKTIKRLRKAGVKISLSSVIEEFIDYFIALDEEWAIEKIYANSEKKLEDSFLEGK